MQDLSGPHSYAHVVAEIRDFAIFLIDCQGRVASWNEGARLLFGYEAEEIVGQMAQQLLVPEDREIGAAEREFDTARRQGRAEEVRWHLKKDGSRFWANGVTTALKDGAGKLVGFAKIARDETERQAIEAELRRTGAQLQTALDAGRIGTWRWEIAPNRVVADPNLARLFQVSPQSAAGGPVEDYTRAVHPDDYPRLMAVIQNALETGLPYTEEFRIMQSDGSHRWIEARGQIERDAQGVSRQINGVIVDISERRKLADQGRIFEQLVHFSPDFIAMCDLNYQPIYRNPAVEKIVGVRQGEMAKKPSITDYFYPEDHAFMFGEFFPRVIREGQGTTEIRLRHLQTGETVWMDYRLFVLRDANDQPAALAAICTDITARKKNEAEREKLVRTLEFERGRLAAIFQSAPAFVAVLRGPQHVFEMANPNYYQLIGHRNIIGKPLLEALPEIEGQGFVEILNGVLGSGLPHEDREIPVKLQRWADGPIEERFVDLLYQPLFEADGTVSGVFSHGVDITEQVRARRAAEEANRVKDEFLATLSHELRTPLTAIIGWASILQDGDLSAEDTQQALDTIERNARAQGQLIEDILDVSRVITGKLRLEVRPVDLAGLIDEAVATVTPAAQAKQIQVQRVLDERADIVSGDPARLNQIVWNLLSNAIKFTPRGGQVQIRLERVESHVEITVSDSGIGIAPEMLPHVFERFRQADSTSTRKHGGVGLGLAIVRHLVELHGGSVEASSQGLGLGAEFVVQLPLIALRSLPLAADKERRAQPTVSLLNAPEAAPRLDGVHVLVVDDHADTRALLARVLEGCGARVSLAASAAEALGKLQLLRPDVLLSDVGMPGEDGYTLIKRVRALPQERGGATPAAALTAFARVSDRVKVLRCGFQIHLPKPVEPLELVTIVATLAGRRGEE